MNFYKLREFFSTIAFKIVLSEFRWYRRWYGGRWERHYIEICHSDMWLDMHPERMWPSWRQPCSRGTPEIETYPTRLLVSKTSRIF